MRERILSATRELLRERRFDALSVADILTAAEVSRASFYFYFPSKQAVLGELVRDAVTQGQQAARPWVEGLQIDGSRDPVAALRAGVRDGARLWRDNAGVLMAIVENQGSDDGLRALWLEQMDLFTDAAAARIESDPQARGAARGHERARRRRVAGPWMGERLYYRGGGRCPPVRRTRRFSSTSSPTPGHRSSTAGRWSVRKTPQTDHRPSGTAEPAPRPRAAPAPRALVQDRFARATTSSLVRGLLGWWLRHIGVRTFVNAPPSNAA
ncbi:hypothetical protein B1L11_20605 [Microbispora sp. GKU 823]|nr:hypothetical protein B1L11_20605 [Microbispora sp. GKU 823]